MMIPSIVQSTTRHLSVALKQIAFPNDPIGKIANLALLGLAFTRFVGKPLAERLFFKQNKIDEIRFHSLIVSACKMDSKEYFKQAQAIIKSSDRKDLWLKLAVNFAYKFPDSNGELKAILSAAPTPELRFYLFKQISYFGNDVQAQIDIAMNMIQPESRIPFGLGRQAPSQDSLIKAAHTLIDAKKTSSRLNSLLNELESAESKRTTDFNAYIAVLNEYALALENFTLTLSYHRSLISHMDSPLDDTIKLNKEIISLIMQYLERVDKSPQEDRGHIPIPDFAGYGFKPSVGGNDPKIAHYAERAWLEKAVEIIAQIKDEAVQIQLSMEIYNEFLKNDERRWNLIQPFYDNYVVLSPVLFRELLNTATAYPSSANFLLDKIKLKFGVIELQIMPFIQPLDNKGQLHQEKAREHFLLLDSFLSLANETKCFDSTYKGFINCFVECLETVREPQESILQLACHFGKVVTKEKQKENFYGIANNIAREAIGQPCEQSYCMQIANAFAKSKNIQHFHDSALQLTKQLPDTQVQPQTVSKFEILKDLYIDFSKNGDKNNAQNALEAMADIVYPPEMWKTQFYNLCELAQINQGIHGFPKTDSEQKNKNIALVTAIMGILHNHQNVDAATMSSLYLHFAITLDSISHDAKTPLQHAITLASQIPDINQRKDTLISMLKNNFDLINRTDSLIFNISHHLDDMLKSLTLDQKRDSIFEILKQFEKCSNSLMTSLKSDWLLLLQASINQITNPTIKQEYMIKFCKLAKQLKIYFIPNLSYYLETISGIDSYTTLKLLFKEKTAINPVDTILALVLNYKLLKDSIAIKLIKIKFFPKERDALFDTAFTQINGMTGREKMLLAKELLTLCLDYGHLKHVEALRNIFEEYFRAEHRTEALLQTAIFGAIWGLTRLYGAKSI